MNVPDSTTSAPMPQSKLDQMRAKILDLQEMLARQLPGYESLLQTIHRNLAEDSETVHLLSEQEIGVIVSGLSKKTGIYIAAETARKKKNEKITLSDL